MNTQSVDIASWLRTGVVCIALSLATAQTARADVLRPTVDTGGPGGGTSSAEVYYELEHEQGRPVVVEQEDFDSAELADYQRSQVWPNFNLENAVAQQPIASMLDSGSYVIVEDSGIVSIPDQQAAQTASSDDSLPAFAVHPNLRSILEIEGKQAVAEVAQPASVSAYAICLACSTLG